VPGAAERPLPGARRLASATGVAGELALLERDGHLELISNGVFLLDTRADGASERLLVDAAVADVDHPVERLLLGGLGFGYSLAAASAHLPEGGIVVVEREPAIVDWNLGFTAARSGGSVAAPGVRCVVGDLVAWLQDPARDAEPGFDVICLDVDNGPGWLVNPTNAWLYEHTGLATLHRHLRAGGVLAVWSAAADDAFRDRLAAHFHAVDAREVPAVRGEPDVLYLARR
jgi:spermidine synthase